jgi:hypothetical protein
MRDPNPENLAPAIDAVPADLKALVDGYVADALDAAGMAALEVRLKADPSARRFFVRYAQLDRDLRLEAHARLQGEAALAKIGGSGGVSVAISGVTAGTHTARFGPARWSVAAAVVALAVGAGWWMARDAEPTRPTTVSSPTTLPAAPDLAWLVNAQNCQWADGAAPADMKRGTVLNIDRGLAEVKFRAGAVVLLEGPARLELLTGNSARLLHGRLTGRVTGPVKGFELLSPRGKVIDLGTEFGVSVAEGGETDVYVFKGKVQAVGGDAKVLDLTQAQSARIDAGGASVRPNAGPADAAAFVRDIVAPPVIEPKTSRMNFGKAYDGTLADAVGSGTGLTHRLPGTGHLLPETDPNLVVDSESGRLALTTTKSDINGQRGLATGEYLGVRLADLGFTGPEDFEVQVFMPNIPALQNVGQFGLYAGAKCDKVIRGGLISRGAEGPYTIFMTNNDGGRDLDSHFLGLFSMGDDLRIRLKRTNGKYAMTVENVTTGSASTLAIRHPAFLDPERDLYVGLFGANTGSEIRRTLFIKEFAVTVWTKSEGTPAVADADRGR